MSLVWKGVPVPTLVAILILILSGILHIIGLATPYWHEEVLTNSAITYTLNHFGLWVQCSKIGLDAFDCGQHVNLQGFVVAVRAMEILALLLGAICIIVTGIWAFLKVQKFRTILKWSSVIIAFLAALFGMIGIIIYGVEVNRNANKSTSGELIEENLSWSFALCTVSMCLTIVCTVLLAVGVRMVD